MKPGGRIINISPNCKRYKRKEVTDSKQKPEETRNREGKILHDWNLMNMARLAQHLKSCQKTVSNFKVRKRETKEISIKYKQFQTWKYDI